MAIFSCIAMKCDTRYRGYHLVSGLYHLIYDLYFAILCDVLDNIHPCISGHMSIYSWLGPVPNRWSTDSVLDDLCPLPATNKQFEWMNFDNTTAVQRSGNKASVNWLYVDGCCYACFIKKCPAELRFMYMNRTKYHRYSCNRYIIPHHIWYIAWYEVAVYWYHMFHLI